MRARDTGYTDPDEVLRDADIAMYEAKARQRGTYAFFDHRWRDANCGDSPDSALDGSA